MTNRTALHRTGRWLALGGIIALVLAALLALDLRYHGLAWRTFWSLTGEEAPAGQIRGMVEWLGGMIRAQPTTESLAVITHTGENPYGINTFLEQEVEPAKRERQLQMIADAGFHWIRQEFPWEDIEIAGRGDFVDRRNDHDGDGQPDAIDAWAKYDNIVDLATQHGLEMQVRLSNPPQWAQASEDGGNFAPPADVQDYVNFAAAVAERYKGRVRHYQIWNEPNIYPEWGEQAVNPEGYTELLCRTYDALKAIDPDIVVIDGALAPTVSLTGRDLSDFIFLQRMYDAGAAGCFDIQSMQGYGLYSGPTDRRMRPTTINFSRNLYIRDLMVANGDAGKAIWISEAAWSPVGEADVPLDIVGYGNYGKTTLEQAARYMPIAYQRAREEWSWVGVVNYWFFKRASDADINQASYYFRMVEPDFTPLPIYDAMRQFITQETPTLYIGIHQENDRAIHLPADAQIVTDAGAQLHRAAELMEGSETTFTAHGTDVSLRVFTEYQSIVRVAVDGVETASISTFDHWQQVSLYHAALPETHTFQLTVTAMSGRLGRALLDSVMVLDGSTESLIPVIGVAAVLALVTVGVVASALWRRFGHG
jgi:polysaccharide biosynthesis protein PslG